MPDSELFYELSLEAEKDIEEIFDYTEQIYSLEQAVAYVSQFETLFEKLIHNPQLGRKRDEIRKSLRSLPKEHHVVFYRIFDDRVRIVRILHESRDLPKFFD